MKQKIFTFRASTTTRGTVSVFAPNLELAKTIAHTLSKHDIAQINIEQGSGSTDIELESGHENTHPEDGTHMFNTPKANAQENEEAMNDYSEEM